MAMPMVMATMRSPESCRLLAGYDVADGRIHRRCLREVGIVWAQTPSIPTPQAPGLNHSGRISSLSPLVQVQITSASRKQASGSWQATIRARPVL